MLTRISIIIASFVLTILLLSPAQGELRIVNADDHGLTVEYKPQLTAPTVVTDSVVHISLQNGTIQAISGYREQPVRVITVAVPPGSAPTVSLINYESGQVWNGTLPMVVDNGVSLETETTIASSPPTTGVIGTIEHRTLGGLQVVRILIHPVKQNNQIQQVELADRIELKVQFNNRDQTNKSHPILPNRLSQLVVMNADQAAQWGSVTVSNFSDPSWPQGYLYKFNIEREGVYRLTYDELVRGGVDIPSGTSSERLKLFGNGGYELSLDAGDEAPLGLSECAIYIEDNGDGTFDSGDYLIFYGRGAGGWVQDRFLGYRYDVHNFAPNNVYWLNIDPSGSGLRMDGFNQEIAVDSVTNIGRIRYYSEPEVFIYHREGFIGTGTRWYGNTLDGPSQISFSVTANTPITSLPATLRTRIVLGDGRGNIEVELNRNRIGEFTPQSTGHIGINQFDDINGDLTNGVNTISFEQTEANAKVLFDWLELTYYGLLDKTRTFEALDYVGNIRYELSLSGAWIFDVTDHNNVKLEQDQSFSVTQERESAHRYMAVTSADFQSVTSGFKDYFPPESDVSNLWSSNNRADVVLITPDGYWDETEPLLDFYRNREVPLQPVRVRLSEVYNRFSGGLTTPVAIRNMLMYASETWNDSNSTGTVDYVMFCGDGDYNYRHIGRPTVDNFLPPYEWDLYSSDDWFVDFNSDVVSVLPEMVTGRLTATSAYELRNIIEKIISYSDEPEFGMWRNRATLVADDEFADGFSREYQHVEYSEYLSNNYFPETMDKVKVFLTEYSRQWGRDKPQATDDLIESLNRGTLLVNYIGHGNPTLWAHEHVFVQSRDLPRLERTRRLPLFLAFTCDWAYWDDPSVQSFPEQLLAEPQRGAIAAIASTRLTYSGSNHNLAREFYERQFGSQRLTIGEALASAKHSAVNPYSATYHLLGDPTIYLATPRLEGQFTSLVEPLTPLAVSSVAGEVFGLNGALFPSFTGEVEFLALDTQLPQQYIIVWYDSQGARHEIVLNYLLSGPTVYRGLFNVSQGQFNGQFVVPRDVTLGGELGQVYAYFHDDVIDGVIAIDSVSYADQVADAEDLEPPDIQIYFDHRGFREGDPVGSQPLLIVDLSDSSGLNLTGTLGHGVRLSIDGGDQQDLTPFFRNNLDDYQSGSLEQRIGPLETGTHNITIEAWDSFNNIDIASVDVNVVASNGGLSVYNVLNLPNPFKDRTQLSFLVNGEGEYEIMVYTVGGRLIKDYRGTASQGYNAVEWDGKDRAGRSIANGVYLYKVNVRDIQGNKAEGLGRIAYIR